MGCGGYYIHSQVGAYCEGLVHTKEATMHDSRGAPLKVGDRVLIEAEVCQLSEGGDENYCCVDVQVIAPEQVNKDKVMSPPKFTSLSTRMLTRVGAAVMLVLALTLPSIAQTITTTYPDGRTVKFELP